MFFSEFVEKNQEEIILKDDDPDDFIELLNVIYPSASSTIINQSNVGKIYKLADKYCMTHVMFQCEKYMKPSQFGSGSAWLLAEKYSVSELMMNPFVSNGNKLRWKIENIKDLDEIERYSEEFEVGPIEWRITILKENHGLLGNLLYAGNNYCEKQWICQTNIKTTLINQNEKGTDIVLIATSCYSNDMRNWCVFANWNELIKDGIVKNDSIIIEVDLSMKYYDFSKNIPNLTDITFKVEGIEFFTNKAILCIQSKYFYDLFINKNYDERVIEIEDIELNEFRFFLASFYSFYDGVDEENYENLIKLAEKYKVSTLHNNCEQYLLKDVRISLEKKLEYADKCMYYNLMKQSIKSLHNAQKIKNIRKSYEFYKFKDSTKQMILKRILDFI